MKHDINRWLFEIPVDDVRSEDYKEGRFINECFCCGKEVKNPKYWVHMLTTGNLVSSAEDFDESQGFFPVGAGCRHKLPNNFYFTADVLATPPTGPLNDAR